MLSIPHLELWGLGGKWGPMEDGGEDTVPVDRVIILFPPSAMPVPLSLD